MPQKKDKLRHLSRILEEIEAHRKDAEKKGLAFAAPSEKEIRRKLQRTKSPMITFSRYTGGTLARGGSLYFGVGVFNPDPTPGPGLIVYTFFGPANLIADVGIALSVADARFPKLTLTPTSIDLAPGASQLFDTTIPIPRDIAPGAYLLNAFLFRSIWFDAGFYLDRAMVPLAFT